jgi:hypothetical protein
VDTNADMGGLRELALEKQLRAAKWQALRKADQTEISPDQVVIAPEERQVLLQQLYTNAVAKGLITPSSNIVAQIKPPKRVAVAKPAVIQRGATQLIARTNAPAAAAAPAVAQASPAVAGSIEEALLASLPVSDDDFQALAASRAKAVREYVLQGGKVEGERVFLTEAQTGGIRKDGARVYLQLQ